MKTGIDSIAFYTPKYFLDLKTLAAKRGVSAEKFTLGIGQERMSVPPPDEDIVTMGAHAAREALAHTDPNEIDMLMFATESGIDQSKAAAIYVHSLLKLPESCQSFELKQACCSGTAGLQLALAHVKVHPDRKILLVASDVARYGLGSAGEPTQGAGAVAMVLSANPKLLAIEDEFGGYTEDVMDFWRPNYMEEALVDGKYSIKVYLRALSACWTAYTNKSNRTFNDMDRFCYHLPFTRMAEKAHVHLARMNDQSMDPDRLEEQLEASLRYNRMTGNCYTASLYEGLVALLQTSEEDLTGDRVGLFSYGSGCMAVFFSGIVQEGYRDLLKLEANRRMLADRIELSYDDYETFYSSRLPTDGRDFQTDRHEGGVFRLAGVRNHKRQYEKAKRASVASASAEPTASVDTKVVAK